MSWTESDHARLIALKQQRMRMLREGDGNYDKAKVAKLTVEIKAIKKRLIAHEKGQSVAIDAKTQPELELKSDSVATQDPSDDEAKSEGEEGKDSPSSEPKEVEKLTWPQFRSKHKGKPKEEISSLWAEYKESLN